VKSQNPTLNTQRSVKTQASKGWEALERAVKYPEGSLGQWALNEGPVKDNNGYHAFDLEERTAKFGEVVVRFSKKVPRNPGNDRLVNQIVGCGTSIGANYLEASEGVSKKDFKFSICRCVKEAKETKYFLRMIAASEPVLAEEARALYREAHELHLIFASIFRKP
jgi:four helix bundle protein